MDKILKRIDEEAIAYEYGMNMMGILDKDSMTAFRSSRLIEMITHDMDVERKAKLNRKACRNGPHHPEVWRDSCRGAPPHNSVISDLFKPESSVFGGAGLELPVAAANGQNTVWESALNTIWQRLDAADKVSTSAVRKIRRLLNSTADWGPPGGARRSQPRRRRGDCNANDTGRNR